MKISKLLTRTEGLHQVKEEPTELVIRAKLCQGPMESDHRDIVVVKIPDQKLITILKTVALKRENCFTKNDGIDAVNLYN